jgi:hypothetical protein
VIKTSILFALVFYSNAVLGQIYLNSGQKSNQKTEKLSISSQNHKVYTHFFSASNRFTLKPNTILFSGEPSAVESISLLSDNDKGIYTSFFAGNFEQSANRFTPKPNIILLTGEPSAVKSISLLSDNDKGIYTSFFEGNFEQSANWFTPKLNTILLSGEPSAVESISWLSDNDKGIYTSFFAENFEQESTGFNRKRFNIVVGSASLGFVGGMSALYMAWYRNQDGGSFNFQDDFKAWKGMDKFGHATSGYQIANYGTNILDWTGLDRRKSAIYSTMAAMIFLTTVEVFDGFSENYGFSVSDMGANFIGGALFLGQEMTFKKQIFNLKFSYSPSPYANYRPELLGENALETWLKDYNGQTYWLSGNLKDLGVFSAPKWLNLAVGYGASGMTGSFANPSINGAGEVIPAFNRSNYFFLSPDISLRRIKTKSKFLNSVLFALDLVKFPLPAISVSSGGRVLIHGVKF